MYMLTDEQKAQVLAEVAHYLEMDCYDFGVSVGPFSLLAGELAEQAENAMMELDGGDFDEPETIKEKEDGVCVDGGSRPDGTALQNGEQHPQAEKR